MQPLALPTLLWLLVVALLSRRSIAATPPSRVRVDSGEPDGQGRPTISLSIDPAEGFTMVMASYKRDENLPPLINHLTTKAPPSLRHIVIVWQNVDVDLPDFLNATALERYSTSGVVITVRKSKNNSMNERFRPLLDWDEEIYTRAVMIIDDDVVLRKDALEWGYQEFTKAAEDGAGRLTGFMARDFDDVDGDWSYTLRPKKTYSMVLSNAAWLRKEWLDKYWEDSAEMRSLRDYVDEVMNCDDILINYLVSNVTGNPPLLLQPKTPLRIIGGDGMFARGSIAVDEDGAEVDEPPAADTGNVAGIPSAGHFSQRKLCLKRYFEHFAHFARSSANSKHYPLVKTSTSVSQDVEDHSRWLTLNEPWEEIVWNSAPLEEREEEGEAELEELDLYDEDEDEEAEKAAFEEMLQGMSDEEIDDLLKEMQEAAAKEDGLGDIPELEPSVFDDLAREHEGETSRPHAHDEL
ncbi:EXTL2-like UDP-GlcNAc:heparan alpha-N-acetylhexosaminyltransferase [Rhodotorula toruloides]|uniref:EXTL2-like UDP-GlcNAc:heparan alpha-N-acetylhexosaminyltransferase n=1 Tax=Rhodotorula toruloides TaxID=5286 RepID=A0A511KAQ0_RHOTO|nr:EXTL2-like UDP-GlcNAc:heparan alpha-N-acetylhexosaminyltransferase [Rhodotorula toruloides]